MTKVDGYLTLADFALILYVHAVEPVVVE